MDVWASLMCLELASHPLRQTWGSEPVFWNQLHRDERKLPAPRIAKEKGGDTPNFQRSIPKGRGDG